MSPTIPKTDLAIIGAGLAGASMAYFAKQSGLSIAIIEKSRGTGGRSGSKRLAEDSVDMGASIISLHDDNLSELRTELLDNKVLAAWQSGHVGVPRMSAVTRYLTKDATLYMQSKVHHVERLGQYWLLRDENYQPIIQAKLITIATPAIQAAMLLATIPNTGALLTAANNAGMHTQAQWSMWLKTEKSDSAALQTTDHNIIQTLIKDSDKPGRQQSDSDTWVIQSTPRWSADNIDADKANVQRSMCEAFQDITQLDIVDIGIPHRWLLGRQLIVESPLSFLMDPQKGLIVIGDWLCQGDAEGALLSGQQAAHAVISNKYFNLG